MTIRRASAACITEDRTYKECLLAVRQVTPVPAQSAERLLHDVLRARSAAQHDVGQPDQAERVRLVQSRDCSFRAGLVPAGRDIPPGAWTMRGTGR